MNVRIFVNHIIIKRVLLEKNKQSMQKFTGLMNWTAIFNLSVFLKSPPLISDLFLKNTIMYIENFKILKTNPYKIIKLAEKDKSEPK